MSEAQVLGLIGPGWTRGPEQVEGATGYLTHSVSHPRLGLELLFARTTKGGASTLDRFSAKAPCPWTTNRGIGIGTARADAERAYAADRATDSPTRDDQLVVDSYYGGLILDFENGAVTSVFIGAAAE